MPLSDLEDLAVLVFTNTSLNGTLPPEWPEKMPQLRQLDLAYNNLYGGLPLGAYALKSNPWLTQSLNQSSRHSLSQLTRQCVMSAIQLVELKLMYNSRRYSAAVSMREAQISVSPYAVRVK